MEGCKEVFEDMMKRFLVVGLIIFAFMFNSVSVSADGAKTLGDLRRTYNELLEEKKKNDSMSAEAKAEIARKEAAVKQAEADIHKAEEEMETAQANIDESNQKIEESNQRIEKLTKEVEKVLLYLQQMQGQNAYVEYVSGASTMTDLITRIAAVEQVSNHIQRTMKSLEEEIQSLEAEVKRNEDLKVELNNKKVLLEKQSQEYKRIIAANYEKLEEYDKYAPKLEDKIKAAKQDLDLNVAACQKKLGRTTDDVLLSQCSDVPLNSGWLKPVNSGIIMSEVGARWGSYHNALDIGGPSPYEGTPVYAAAAGIVRATLPRQSCGGNMLFIDVVVNGQQYLTYYYHLLNFNVNVGDIVDQGTIIGWVGGYSTSTAHGGYDRCTTGAHLHFGVATGTYDPKRPSPQQGRVIVPPGFPNRYGWRFTSRTQMYNG